jgi:hypothetical protein
MWLAIFLAALAAPPAEQVTPSAAARIQYST